MEALQTPDGEVFEALWQKGEEQKLMLAKSLVGNVTKHFLLNVSSRYINIVCIEYFKGLWKKWPINMNDFDYFKGLHKIGGFVSRWFHEYND